MYVDYNYFLIFSINAQICIEDRVNSVYKWRKNWPSRYLLRFRKGNTRVMWGFYSKLTIKTPERYQWRRFGVYIINFQQILHIIPLFRLLTLKKWMPTSDVWQYHKCATVASIENSPANIYFFNANNKNTFDVEQINISC